MPRRRNILRIQPMLLVLIVLAVLPAGAFASYANSIASSTNVAGTDGLNNYFSIVPGTAVQPGTSTPIASGSGNSLTIAVGRVPDSRTITDVVRVTNVTGAAHTLDLAKLGTLTPLIGFEFSDGTTSKSVAPGATWQLRVRSDAATAGSFSGSGRFELSGDSFLRYDRPLAIDQAPNTATSLSIAAPDGTAKAALSWTAAASTGVAGYNVYRATSAGGTYSKVNGSLVTGTSYNDTSVTLGGDYWYRVRAVASGVSPELESVDSNTANIAVLPIPTSVSVPSGASNTANYVSNATQSSATVNVVVPSATAAGDTVRVAVSSGATVVYGSATAAGGSQTVAISGLNLSALADGAITLAADIQRGSFDSPDRAGSATKDSVVPAAPTAASVPATGSNPVNYINIATASAAGVSVTSAATASETIEARLTSGSTATGSTSGGSSPKTVTINASTISDSAVGGVTVQARVVDLAGNASSWFTGTAATKDTVAPTLNYGNVIYTQYYFLFVILTATDVKGNNGAATAGNLVGIHDYSNGNWYGWYTANGSGNFGTIGLANNGTPRKLGYDVIDLAGNQAARVCRNYTGNGSGSSTTC